MRELLAKWAGLEPDKCELYPATGEFKIATKTESMIGYYLNDKALAWIQYAVQQAIVSRGWSFEISYYSILTEYEAEIDIDSHRSFCRSSNNSMAEALLTAYLKALEESR